MKPLTFRTSLAAAASALLAGSLSVLGPGASPAAAAGEVRCNARVTGKADGYIRTRVIEDDVVTSGSRSPSTFTWAPRAWIPTAELGGSTYHEVVNVVPTSDGRSRVVTVGHDSTQSVMTYFSSTAMERANGTLVTDWNPREVAGGSTDHLYTISPNGTLKQFDIVRKSGVGTTLGPSIELPITMPSTTTMAGTSAERNGVTYNILYAINPTAGKLEQIVVRPDRPGEAKKYTVRGIGTGWEYMSVGWCFDDDGPVQAKNIIVINPTTGIARSIRQSSAIDHSTTFTSPVRVGTDGTWKWTGISS
ncbi:hypothetical protein G5C66_15395 [Nocardioides sp. KC13]|uniref:Uncharacterized protein n=1 Tax=Nocardioides turkmenicus TaxID=2711220 RepID=A0A6M1R5Z3_9ACTN|nr:hypothetical protein [Nocardioides sp. KC13]NGN94121.1 hypothetical protein [Nocardioides sp. KC13]